MKAVSAAVAAGLYLQGRLMHQALLGMMRCVAPRTHLWKLLCKRPSQ